MKEIAGDKEQSSPFGKCIRKNYNLLLEWSKQSKTNCFRVYDREIAGFPFAIDFYAGRLCVQYFSPSRRNDEPPSELVEETIKVLCSIFETTSSAIYWRTRVKSKETRQYEKADESKEFFTALEYGIKFKINLRDYLDTGLFLDHRETRQIVATISKGKCVLNLFAYTCSFSVHAAAAGSAFTKSVDMSNTYIAWGKDNFILNSLSLKNNQFIRADCIKFLNDEIRSGIKYDIIIIDPPTISRSKKMNGMFDIQVDYISLISKALKLLLKGGVIFFSTNSRKFVFENACFPSCSIVEITDKTIPIDFHDPQIHRCWEIKQND